MKTPCRTPRLTCPQGQPAPAATADAPAPALGLREEALVAIGGASFTVPFLTWCNVRVQNAIGTSAAIGFPIALGGTLGYIYNGWGLTNLPTSSFGFIYLPALAWMVPFSMLMAPLGARLTHRLPAATLKRVFACLLILLAAKMLWKLFS